MPGVSLLRLFSQCKQASTFLLVNWSRPHRRQPPLPHPSPHYCQSTLNTPSTADRNHVEELLLSIEPRMCLYKSKNWAISIAVGVVPLWLWMLKKQTVVQIKDPETRAKVNWKHEVTWGIKQHQSTILNFCNVQSLENSANINWMINSTKNDVCLPLWASFKCISVTTS